MLKCRYFEWDNSCLNLEGAFCGWYQLAMIIIIDATSHIYHVTWFTIVMPALIVAQKLESIAGDGSCDSNHLFLLGAAFGQLRLRQCELLMGHTAYPGSMSQIEGV